MVEALAEAIGFTGVAEVIRDEEGMNNMRNLGKNMAFLLKKVNGDKA